MSSEVIIKTRSLGKDFLLFKNPTERLFQIFGIAATSPKHCALDDINIEVTRGETVGIIGVNGSGKSTLLQLICGTMQPTRGSITVNGRIAALLELGSGFNPEFTGVENVYLSATLMGLSKAEIGEVFEDIIEFADIGDFVHQPVKTYSSGMFARLAFSTAIHSKPEILVIDEILAVGDSRFQRKCLDKFAAIKEQGCTILFVSHDDYQVRNICDRVLYLNGGSQKFFGPVNEGVNYYLQDLQSSEKKGLCQQTQTVEAKKLVAIKKPMLIDGNGLPVCKMKSGVQISISFEYTKDESLVGTDLTFVFNLYRKDGVYVCGTTTAMQGAPIVGTPRHGKVTVTFPCLKLLAGIYNWRVAVNDAEGIQIIDELVPVCEFSVEDSFKAVGIYDIDHQWNVVSC